MRCDLLERAGSCQSCSALASGIGMVRAFAVSPPGEEVYNDDITDWFLAFGALTCISNVYCVIVIAYKAW